MKVIVISPDGTTQRADIWIGPGNGYLRNDQGLFISTGSLRQDAFRIQLDDAHYLLPHVIVTFPSEDNPEIILGICRSDDNEYEFVEGWRVIPETTSELHKAAAGTLAAFYETQHHLSPSDDGQFELVPNF